MDLRTEQDKETERTAIYAASVLTLARLCACICAAALLYTTFAKACSLHADVQCFAQISRSDRAYC